MVSRTYAKYSDISEKLKRKVVEPEELICQEGFMVLYKAMNNWIDEDIGHLCQTAKWVQDGFLPDTGGISEQSYKAILAIAYWRQEEKVHKKELEESKSK